MKKIYSVLAMPVRHGKILAVYYHLENFAKMLVMKRVRRMARVKRYYNRKLRRRK